MDRKLPKASLCLDRKIDRKMDKQTHRFGLHII